jgi:hypothetical protein
MTVVYLVLSWLVGIWLGSQPGIIPTQLAQITAVSGSRWRPAIVPPLAPGRLAAGLCRDGSPGRLAL